MTPNFSNHSILYTFASEKSYAAILTQVNEEKVEAPISFFSSNLQGPKLNYSNVEKQVFPIFKSIKHFRPFLLKTHTKVILSFLAVKNMLIQRDVGEKRANWLTTLQEYDIENRPTKIVKGKGFCRMLAGASDLSTLEDLGDDVHVYEICLNDIESSYADIIFYLRNGYAST